MLQNNLFTFTDLMVTDGTVTTTILLNPGHVIFDGHFPGQPVLPGVCSLQIVKEMLEAHLKKPTQLIKSTDIRFLATIVPERDKPLRLKIGIELKDEQFDVNAALSNHNVILFKFKGAFKEVSLSR